jgi:hypothetical protein
MKMEEAGIKNEKNGIKREEKGMNKEEYGVTREETGARTRKPLWRRGNFHARGWRKAARGLLVRRTWPVEHSGVLAGSRVHSNRSVFS